MTDPERKEVDLKPCPFCGIESHICEDHISPYAVSYTPECMNPKCSASLGKFFNKQETTKAWNKRPQNNNALVPLDVQKVYDDLYYRTFLAAHFKNDETAKEIIMGIAKRVCDKFSQQPPKERKVSLEEIKEVCRRFCRCSDCVTCKKISEAILSLLNATKERMG